MESMNCSTSSVQEGEGDVEIAESIYIQGIKRALSIDQLIQDIKRVAVEKEKELDEAEARLKEREKNGYNLLQDVDPEDLLPYDFKQKASSRMWIKDIFLEEEEYMDDSSDSEVTQEEYRDMLRLHVRKKKSRAELEANSMLSRYMYYSSDFVTGDDKWSAHCKSFKNLKKKKRSRNNEKMKPKKYHEKSLGNYKKKGGEEGKKDGNDSDNDVDSYSSLPTAQFSSLNPRNSGTNGQNQSTQAKKKKQATVDNIRKRIWKFIAKKEIPKAYRLKSQIRSNNVTQVKKISRECMRRQRASAAISVKFSKDKIGKARRITREMQLFWKRYSKVEKVHRKKAKKHALEQIRLDEELREAKRQQRKLNFLISQTELFAHFISKKLNKQSVDVGEDTEVKSILRNIENDYVNSDSLHVSVSENIQEENEVDDHDGSYYCDKAMKNVKRALEMQNDLTTSFETTKEENDTSFMDSYSLMNPSISTNEEVDQPSLFQGILKSYQVKGMNWLINLYEQGINGILADEMGLGKTVQTIAFLGHLAEKINIWGPFLVVAPASTLNNWHQEFSRFFPDFKVLPYWGNTSDRKVLRKFWNQKVSQHSERLSAPFHILITSYQLVISDVRYFQRIKWQYMILDEAQALKSSSSVRWKILLDFKCRNRLLLTGTPIQNTMAELWALLHFIMPSLFDSHEEFNEWFSKDIENHIENKVNIDEKQLSRLHIILKPFMLRRLKRNVENELSEKIEIRVHCSLTPRQSALYVGIKKKLKLDDLFKSTGSTIVSCSSSTTLMNIVMQFRKVCNHPDLFERREVISPTQVTLPTYLLPRLLYRDGILCRINPGKRKLLYNDLNIHHPCNVHQDLVQDSTTKTFSFLRILRLNVDEYWYVMIRDVWFQWLVINTIETCTLMHYFSKMFKTHSFPNFFDAKDVPVSNVDFLPTTSHKQTSMTKHSSPCNSPTPDRADTLLVVHVNSNLSAFNSHSPFRKLLFTQGASTFYKHGTQIIYLQARQDDSLTEKQLHSAGKQKKWNISSELIQCFTPRSFQQFYRSPIFAKPCKIYCCDRTAFNEINSGLDFGGNTKNLLYGPNCVNDSFSLAPNPLQSLFSKERVTGKGLTSFSPPNGWSNIQIPSKDYLITDSGKMYALDVLLRRLKQDGHRVLIYSQMTKMIDLLEEYMWYRQHTYMRLDGSSRISERRDMVANFQTRDDIFVFLLSTRAGGLGINLTAADTVIFYDSDWNPTVDQQAMDRAHRLGQTKQVTVYRLVCEGTVDERILQRAEEKSVIQRMVIAGGNFRPDTLKPKEVMSLLLDDKQLANRLKMKKEENRGEGLPYKGKKRGRKTNAEREAEKQKQSKLLPEQGLSSEHVTITHSAANTPTSSKSTPGNNQGKSLSTSSPTDLDTLEAYFDSAQSSPVSEMSGCSDLRGLDEDQLIVVDDTSPPALVPTEILKGKRGTGRGRGRPRIRPLMPEVQKRSYVRASTTIARGKCRGIRRGRKVITGRAAAMAGKIIIYLYLHVLSCSLCQVLLW